MWKCVYIINTIIYKQRDYQVTMMARSAFGVRTLMLSSHHSSTSSHLLCGLPTRKSFREMQVFCLLIPQDKLLGYEFIIVSTQNETLWNRCRSGGNLDQLQVLAMTQVL